MNLISKNTLVLLGGVLLTAVGCQSPSEGDKSVEKAAEDLLEYEIPRENEPLEFQRTKVLGKKDTISFDINESSFVRMALSVPGKAGNIRINQLIMPDGERDGPFGQTYEAHLEETGTYQVIIAESMMAEKPYTGDYQLKIELDKE